MVPWETIEKLLKRQRLHVNEVKMLYRLKGRLLRIIGYEGSRSNTSSVVLLTRGTKLSTEEEQKLCIALNLMDRAEELLNARYQRLYKIWDYAIVNHNTYFDTAVEFGIEGKDGRELTNKVTDNVKKAAFVLSNILEGL